MRSGNKPGFKKMGASPVKLVTDPGGKTKRDTGDLEGSKTKEGDTIKRAKDQDFTTKEGKSYTAYKIDRPKKEEKKEPGVEGLDYIKSGDKIYRRTRDEEKKKKRKNKPGTVASRTIKKVFRKRRGTSERRNLVTGGTNTIQG